MLRQRKTKLKGHLSEYRRITPFSQIAPDNVRINHANYAMCGRDKAPQPMAIYASGAMIFA
jgi:hypothetical protein